MDIFYQLALIIVLATVVAGVMRLLKQPLIMGHIITGLIAGPSILGLVRESTTLETFAQLGIAILLFIVGLSLSPKVIKDVGKSSLILGIGQITFTTITGFTLCLILGLSWVPAAYMAIALTFSSTIIVLKLLADKKDLEKLYAKVAIGFLLVQDVAATLLLIILSTFSSGGNLLATAVVLALKIISIVAVLFFVSLKVLPKLADFFAHSQEYLFLFSIAWGFGLSALLKYLGFSIEIGALIAGVSLSVSPYSQEISAKLKPLRDFFIIMFFIFLGTTISFGNASQVLLQTAVFSTFVLVVNPIIVIILMGLLGYNKKTSFQAGTVVGQISEFSLILLLFGYRAGHISKEVVSVATLVGLVTIAGSSYLILYADKIFPRVSKLLNIFYFRKLKETAIKELYEEHEVVLFGCNRAGYDFIRIFRKLGSKFLAIDFDPDAIRDLQKKDVNCIYGDAEDGELLDELNINQAKLVVSTIPDYESNMYLVSKLRGESRKLEIILISYNIDEALKYYDAGASYVILPHFIGGQFAAELAYKAGFDNELLREKRIEHIEYLKERKALGHGHPHHHKTSLYS